MLKRAGYLRGDGELTALGRHAVARLQELAQAHPPAEFFSLIRTVPLRTESGEFYFAMDSGRSEIIRCGSCGYVSLRELARFRKEPFDAEAPRPLERVLTPECPTIEALARFLAIPKEKTAKALMYERPSDGRFVFVAIRGDMQASEAKLKGQLGDIRAATADEIVAAGATPGYASPIGLKGVLVVVDDLIPASANLVAGANEPGYHLKNTNYGRDYTADMVTDIALAVPGAGCPNCGHSLTSANAELLYDAAGCRVGSTLEALAQAHHDDKGLTLPVAAAPFVVYLMHLAGTELDTRAQAQGLQDEWEAAGITVLYDDRDERAGVKFADADLVGCPIRVTVGERGMKDGMVELKQRDQRESTLIPIGETLQTIRSLAKTIP